MPSHQAKAIEGEAEADEHEGEARDEQESTEKPGRSQGDEAEKEDSQTGRKQQQACREDQAGEPFLVPRFEGCFHGTATVYRNIRPVRSQRRMWKPRRFPCASCQVTSTSSTCAWG